MFSCETVQDVVYWSHREGEDGIVTQTTKDIFERFQVRKTTLQKTAFIDYVQQTATALGYESTVEKGSFGVRNIVIGDVDKAKVVYTAHYDTCARLPFPNLLTPKSIPLYLLYQLVLVLVIFAVSAVFSAVFTTVLLSCGVPYDVVIWLDLGVVLIGVSLLLDGPANKHTANDNTSGVTVLLDAMAALPVEDRAHTAFVFFDLEEAGLFGSAAFKKKHKAAMKQTLLVNFDCVSDGETMLVVLRKKAAPFKALLETAFQGNEAVQTEIAQKGVFYPSDQMHFSCGVGVAAFKKTKRRGILYIDRIHTSKDTVYREENIALLTESVVRLSAALRPEGENTNE